MTYAYSEMNQHDALYMSVRAYPGGVEAMAQRLGKSSAVLYSKLRPGVDTHHISFEEAAEIVELCAQAHVPNAFAALHAFNWRLSHACFPVPVELDANPAELIQNVCRAVKEFGDVASCVSESTADGVIDAREFARIEKEFEGVYAALNELRARIKGKFESQDRRASHASE